MLDLTSYLKRLSLIEKIVLATALVLCGVGVFVRLWRLSDVPVSYYHDELDYVLNGESVARFGTDLSGTWSPFQLQPLHTLNYTAEITAGVHGIVQLLFGVGVQTGHTPAALFSLLTILLVCWLIYRYTKKPILTAAVAGILLTNPWFIHISRTGYEAAIALFFQFSFLSLIFISGTTKKLTQRQQIGLILGIVLSMVMSYYLYHSVKFTLIALSLAGTAWLWLQKLDRTWKVMLIASILVTIGILMARSWHQQSLDLFGNRDSELLTLNYASKLVNEQRLTSLPIPFHSLFVNKYVGLVFEIIKHYAGVFDVSRVGLGGYEGGFQFSLIVHGFFYVTTMIYIPLGGWWLMKHYRQLGSFLLLMLFVSPFTSAITISYQSIFRSALTYLLLLIFSGAGAIAAFEIVKAKRWGWLAVSVVGLLMIAEATLFAGLYFSRYPIVAADNHYFAEELVAGYAAHTSGPITVVTDTDPYNKARSLIAYLGLLPRMTDQERLQFATVGKDTFRFDRFVVTTICPDDTVKSSQVNVVESGKFKDCSYIPFLASSSTQLATPSSSLTAISLSSPIDSRSYYYLLNDHVCDDLQVAAYTRPVTLDSFSPVELTDEELCRIWVKSEQFQVAAK